jgi:hypothetical protein
VDLGFSYGKRILGSHQYENWFGVARIAAITFLDRAAFYRLEATLGAGAARLGVTGHESNLSETVLSYVVGVGFGAKWFHIEGAYFGHRGDPCEISSGGTRVCYPVQLGAAILLGVQIPFGL